MSEKKKSRFGDLNLLGIPIDHTLGVGDKVVMPVAGKQMVFLTG